MTTGVPEGVRTFVLTIFSEVVGSSPRLRGRAVLCFDTVEVTFIVIIPSPDTQPFIPMMRPVVISRVTPVGSCSCVSGSISTSW